MPSLIERLQSYMRSSAAERYESVPVPPFTAFFSTDPLIYFNYAIPNGPISGDVGEPLRRLRAEFQARRRVPRFEYVSELAPALADELLAAGFRQEAEARVMVCTRESFTPVEAPEELAFTVLTAGSSREDVRAFCNTGRRGFSLDEPDYEAPEEEISRFLKDLKDGRSVLGRVGGEPAVVGTCTPPSEGIAELAGVATLERFRKRGLGTALTSRAAREAFDRGVDVLFLSTITEQAGRIYERVGFRFVTRMLFYVDAAHPEGASAPVAG